jgi:hypothetical protein
MFALRYRDWNSIGDLLTSRGMTSNCSYAGSAGWLGEECNALSNTSSVEQEPPGQHARLLLVQPMRPTAATTNNPVTHLFNIEISPQKVYRISLSHD